MRYHIDTIPLWDAYKGDSECPLCEIRQQNENAYLDSFLGASVMEPDVRVEVNKKGFCSHHFARMMPMQNRLGLSLMTHTHLMETMAHLPSLTQKKAGPFQKKQKPPSQGDPCILCARLSATMERYLYTLLHLWKTDKDFRQAFLHSKGLCLPHYRDLGAMALREMNEKDQKAFLPALEALQRENMARIEKELEWFTLKFDYRNQDKPWGDSKDAPERAINKLKGKCV